MILNALNAPIGPHRLQNSLQICMAYQVLNASKGSAPPFDSERLLMRAGAYEFLFGHTISLQPGDVRPIDSEWAACAAIASGGYTKSMP
jgi:hypothetical protein